MSLMNNITIYIAFIVVTACLWIYKRLQHWKDNKIPGPDPRFPYGTMRPKKIIQHQAIVNQQHYKQFKGQAPFCGIFITINPAILILDLGLIRKVLIRDFQYFHDRGMYYNEKTDPLSAHIFNLDGQKWKTLRAKLTPTFTSGKMKYMFPTVVAVCHELVNTVDKQLHVSSDIEVRKFLQCFTTDVIGCCAFGLDCNSLKDPQSEFYVMSKKMFEQPRNSGLKRLLIMSQKNLCRFFNVKAVRDDVAKFFLKVVYDTVEYREKNNVQRHDFMDLLLKLKNSIDENERLTLNEIAAQAFVFFLAGFETSSTTMSYSLYELAQNQTIQDKARKCVQDTLKKHDGKLTYEAVNEMSYVEQCINESLRKYPPGASLIRETTKDYFVSEVNYTIKKGTLIMIPTYAIQHDPEYYKDPEEYIPERFEPEQVAKRNPMTFIPFGEGPRNCIGLRFGMLQAKIGLALLLHNFRFTLSPKTEVPLTFSTTNIILTPASGLYLNLEKINN